MRIRDLVNRGSWIRDLVNRGSWIRDGKNRIRDEHPGSATLPERDFFPSVFLDSVVSFTYSPLTRICNLEMRSIRALCNVVVDSEVKARCEVPLN